MLHLCLIAFEFECLCSISSASGDFQFSLLPNNMGLLDKLWDDVLAGPQPDKGLKKLRKERLAAAGGLADVFQDGKQLLPWLKFHVTGGMAWKIGSQTRKMW